MCAVRGFQATVIAVQSSYFRAIYAQNEKHLVYDVNRDDYQVLDSFSPRLCAATPVCSLWRKASDFWSTGHAETVGLMKVKKVNVWVLVTVLLTFTILEVADDWHEYRWGLY